MQVSVQLDGKDHPIEKTEFKIGRGKGRDLQIMRESVSRNHCLITRDEKGVQIKDTSRNGTKVNGEPVKDTAKLEDGDRITLAEKIELVITIEEETEVTIIESNEEKK
jgi:pSer/pThr/pTyr-binding forkhead associated (FHA) protein